MSLVACSAPEGPAGEPASVVTPTTTAPPRAPASTAAVEPTSPPAPSTASATEPPASTKPPAFEGPEPLGVERASQLLYGFAALKAPTTCTQDDPSESIRCLLSLRYGDDAEARKRVLAIYDQTGSVVGVEKAHTMDGGWRGEIRLVPELPVGRHRRHLAWMAEAFEDFERFFASLEEASGKKAGYAWRPLSVQFFRSVGRTTPSAYASDWRIGYNVSGSLHASAAAVRETLFHEIFHLNDRARGRWSEEVLTEDYDAILSGCTTKKRTLSTPCLAPFAPGDTMVRGGTFYAFQPGNGVWEYAAELAIRYYREHRDVLAKKKLAKPPFKCGPEPNGRAWKGLVETFFGGIDLTPDCPK